ncbi:hypothetical protein ED312_00120 [Sinomicrobium pectinilyticum]|uniref:Uncharacterized protein n=1 Tax=Sinomicrobium pectinilyticum TaxID=1084421 RepID=A0A3N0F4W7_SINP1|nr:hypothetical protein [Sinomicrobium pectinilyticum]RNL95047.1 hypothetical protein ED312_00120 [Sinomicrobium pectinilyticum]
MNSKNRPVLYVICIVIGGLLVFIGQDAEENKEIPYVMILGFVLLMFGLYKATTGWVKDNPREDNRPEDNGQDEREDDTRDN